MHLSHFKSIFNDFNFINEREVSEISYVYAIHLFNKTYMRLQIKYVEYYRVEWADVFPKSVKSKRNIIRFHLVFTSFNR